MGAVVFVLVFTLIHTAAYTAAGALALALSRDLYRQEDRALDFLRDMDDPQAAPHVQRWFLPVQLARGALLACVLVPLLGPLGDLSVLMRFAVFFGLAAVWLDLASSVPFPNNLEGFVYFEPSYRRRARHGKLYLETALYALLLAAFAAWLAF
jgi:hypothetical protein